MLFATGTLLLTIGLWLITRTIGRGGRHRASLAAGRRRGAHAPGYPRGQRPHRLEAQDAALSRR